MPCVSLNPRKIYKAKVMKSAESVVKESAPICAADLTTMSQETEHLVNIAAAAEEVLESQQLLSNPQTVPITSAGIKPIKQPLYYKVQAGILRPAQVKRLRRAVVKASRKPMHKSSSTMQHTPDKAPATAPQILLDGTKVQIHAHRNSVSHAGQKIIQGDTKSTTEAKSRRKNVHLFRSTKNLTNKTAEKVILVTRQLRRRPSRAELINAESKLGSTIFGPVPAGHRREFFHDRENIWIWHEDWVDQEHHPRQLTVRYEVRPSGVYKKISAGKYVELKGAELENFRQATKVYLHVIKQKLYAYAK